MIQIAYSELTKHYYFLPVKGKKIDITDDIKEILANDYWKKRCEAAENLLAVMDTPKNQPIKNNDAFILFGERNQIWQKSKYSQP